jgi:RNA polymerase sigma factor (sigma-70 family)
MGSSVCVRSMQDVPVSLTILQRIAAGEAQAVDECLDQYGGLIWSLARRFSPVHADAEDAVQETLLEIWRHACRYDPQVASETAFIATLAKRRLIDRHRKRSRAIAASPIEEEPALASRAAADTVEVQEEAERVRVVMGRLRHDERRVLEMSLVNGLTHSEISEATSLPLGTVKTHARRGLNRLREMLGVDHLSSTPDP